MRVSKFNDPAVFMLIADGTIDQIVENNVLAQKEKRDLEKMGCEVKVRIFRGETVADAWAAAEAYQARKEA